MDNLRIQRWLNVGFGVFSLLLGTWAFRMGIDGRTPVQSLQSGDIPVVIAIGSGGIWTGLYCLIDAVMGDKSPKWVRATLLSGYVVFLAAPFILAGILTPEQIKSSIPGRYTGAVVFVSVGLGLIALIPLFIRRLRKTGTASGSSVPIPEQDLFEKVELIATMPNPNQQSIPEVEKLVVILRESKLISAGGKDVVTISASDITSIYAPFSQGECVRQILRVSIADGKIDNGKLNLVLSSRQIA